jgi:hypothetical protein
MFPVRFEVKVNDTLQCIAGMSTGGYIWAGVEGEDLPVSGDGASMRGTPGGKALNLNIGGLTDSDRLVKWSSTTLKPGDVIQIRILPVGDFDQPTVIHDENEEED